MSENQTTNNPAATQGGNEGPGHVPTDAPADTIYSFNSLKEQKHAAEDKYMARAAASAGEEPPAQKEDTSFMNHKPGGGETLPGWDTMKGIFTGKSE
ncbi:hypothetical protein ASPVEDRAFT_37663 [Aspergillus versicolor CBS 583.65]|uniref:Uncharacterized protein n=1 Tax=Aspergillus versicolor CBS 583.65 TaxID=1036611 RepID=A0A1L9P9M4_ASPVE|nr:uncharacterized protein ASPVEDRAFT_37663 [Aspergillus versicolor CBS 583.65]OJI98221.1 hypothetical protein ASPVEDRAFT_37663 [Aspergillus versicolor CBS 583.65]